MYPSLMAGMKTISAADGWGTRGLFAGGHAALIGYSVQGMCKFGFYEFFKDVYAYMAGDNAERFKVVGWAISSACAEVIADVGLCPWEAIKVRIQTSPEGTFPTDTMEAFRKVTDAEGVNGLYKGLT